MTESRKIQLATGRSSRDRYYLINDGCGMGGAGHPPSHYLNQWSVVNGIDRGNGYQGYLAVDYVLSSESHLPESAKRTIRRTLGIASASASAEPKPADMHLITREQFDKVSDMVEATRKKTRPRIHDLYDVVCAVLYRYDSGIAWRELPDVFPPWRTVHEYSLQWAREVQADGTTTLDKVLNLLPTPSEGAKP